MEPPRRNLLLLSLGIAFTLFFLNNIGILSGWLAPPPGYESHFSFRGKDIAQYVTWANGFRDRYLLPDFLAPWHTEARFFNVVFLLVGRIAEELHVDVRFFFSLFIWARIGWPPTAFSGHCAYSDMSGESA